jgi:hypothetical protein
VDHVLLVPPAAVVVHPGKRCLKVPDGPVHVLLKRWPCISQAKGHLLVPEQAEGGGDGGLLHVLWVDRDLMVPLPQVNLEKTVQPAALVVKYSMLGSGYTSGSVTRLSRRKSPQGRQLPSAFLTM